MKQPWFDNNCEANRKHFYKCLNDFRNDKTDSNRIEMTRARTLYKSTIRHMKYLYDKNQTEKLEKAKFNNAKQYWTLLKCLSTKQCTVSLSAEHFAQYFKAINDPDDVFFQPDEDVIYFNERYLNEEIIIMFGELDIPITATEVRKANKQIKSNKSGGPDKVMNELFIHGVHAYISYLTKLFNKIFILGYFPEKWADGYIVPVHKKGSIDHVQNYRGITLLSCFGKLFSRVINNRLNEWAETYYVYIEAEAGFRKHMATVDNIFVLHGLIKHFVNEGKKLYTAFIGFTKAFDFIVRDILWLKLIKFGVRGKILDIIKSMYQSIKSKVKFNKNISSEFSCHLGVRQGECLSPFLFSIFLNDIEDEFIKQKCELIDIGTLKLFLSLYADDIVIFSESSEGLQKALNTVYEYSQHWKLTVNINKTKIMIFRSGGILPKNLVFTYGGKELDFVDDFKYLGISFTAGGAFTHAMYTLAGQAGKAIFKHNKYLFQFTQLSTKHILELFDKLIKPILHYGSEIWGFLNANFIERAHLRFCKNLLGLKRSTQNDFFYG